MFKINHGGNLISHILAVLSSIANDQCYSHNLVIIVQNPSIIPIGLL